LKVQPGAKTGSPRIDDLFAQFAAAESMERLVERRFRVELICIKHRRAGAPSASA